MIRIYREGNSIVFNDGIAVRFYDNFTLLLDETNKLKPKVKALPVALMKFTELDEIRDGEGKPYKDLASLIEAVGEDKVQQFVPKDYDDITQIYGMNQSDDTAEFWRNRVGKVVIVTGDIYGDIKYPKLEDKVRKSINFVTIETSVVRFDQDVRANVLMQTIHTPFDEVLQGYTYRYIYPTDTGVITDKWKLFVTASSEGGPAINLVQEITEDTSAIPSSAAVKKAIDAKDSFPPIPEKLAKYDLHLVSVTQDIRVDGTPKTHRQLEWQLSESGKKQYHIDVAKKVTPLMKQKFIQYLTDNGTENADQLVQDALYLPAQNILIIQMVNVTSSSEVYNALPTGNFEHGLTLQEMQPLYEQYDGDGSTPMNYFQREFWMSTNQVPVVYYYDIRQGRIDENLVPLCELESIDGVPAATITGHNPIRGVIKFVHHPDPVAVQELYYHVHPYRSDYNIA